MSITINKIKGKWRDFVLSVPKRLIVSFVNDNS